LSATPLELIESKDQIAFIGAVRRDMRALTKPDDIVQASAH
jgi:hypothetical protein